MSCDFNLFEILSEEDSASLFLHMDELMDQIKDHYNRSKIYTFILRVNKKAEIGSNILVGLNNSRGGGFQPCYSHEDILSWIHQELQPILSVAHIAFKETFSRSQYMTIQYNQKHRAIYIFKSVTVSTRHNVFSASVTDLNDSHSSESS
eukprot:TRINITY_DN2297_c0_g2_i1.p1 TRINITY_DN2297_c0_g2~~TRINITY_DN2297_c0_g2_i1.p1  ORF type:complete len:149 (-),score=6.59 TRINITY_DN2297_c0_g2_i1:4-450(-)